MSMDKLDRRILFELERNARITDTKLAKLINRSSETIRYRIDKLQEEGIISNFRIWIDPTKLGYQVGKVYLRLANKPLLKKKFLQDIKKDKRIFWLGLAQGAWNAGITYFIKSPQEFYEIKASLLEKYGDIILEMHIALVASVHVANRTYLYEGENSWCTMFNDPGNNGLGELDRKILKVLAKNARENMSQIARITKSTVDRVRSHMKKLEQRGIIARYGITLDYEKLNHEFYKTFIFVKGPSFSEKKFMQYCLQSKQIIHAVKQIGLWEYELEIMCKNYKEYTNIISDLTKKFAESITNTQTAIMGEDYVFPAGYVFL